MDVIRPLAASVWLQVNSWWPKRYSAYFYIDFLLIKKQRGTLGDSRKLAVYSQVFLWCAPRQAQGRNRNADLPVRGKFILAHELESESQPCYQAVKTTMSSRKAKLKTEITNILNCLWFYETYLSISASPGFLKAFLWTVVAFSATTTKTIHHLAFLF